MAVAILNLTTGGKYAFMNGLGEAIEAWADQFKSDEDAEIDVYENLGVTGRVRTHRFDTDINSWVEAH